MPVAGISGNLAEALMLKMYLELGPDWQVAYPPEDPHVSGGRENNGEDRQPMAYGSSLWRRLMLHIIGLHHRVQAKLPNEDLNEGQKAFSQCLRASILSIKPALVAEEHSKEVLKSLGKVSIAKEIAGLESIDHRFCDPESDERSVIGYKGASDIEVEMSMQSRWDLPGEQRGIVARAIEIGRYFPKREECWLKYLDADLCRSKEVLFACGDVHVESGSFMTLLEDQHVPYKVVERRIGVDHDERYYLALAYLRQHPEVLDAPF